MKTMSEERVSKTVSSTTIRISELMTPQHANILGSVFGGAILALLDKVAYVTASRFAGTVCVTRSFDRVDFHSPIYVGELVHFEGSVDYSGRTSVQVRIEVFAENIHEGTTRHTNSCTVTMVGIDDKGNPTVVPRLICETREEKQRFIASRMRKESATGQTGRDVEMIQRLQDATEDELELWMESGTPEI